jgi:hypothetical protein
MKNRFFLIMGVTLVLSFGILIAVLASWDSIKLHYYFAKLSSDSLEVRRNAIVELAALPDSCMEKLRSKITGSPDELRWNIFEVFRERGDFKDPAKGCRWFSDYENCLLLMGYFYHAGKDADKSGYLEALARINPAMAKARIAKILAGTDKWELKSEAINALSASIKRGRITIESAKTLTKNENPIVVYGVLCALSDIEDNRTAPLISQFVAHEEKEFAFTAMWGLSRMLESMNNEPPILEPSSLPVEMTKESFKRFMDEDVNFAQWASYPPGSYGYSAYRFLKSRGPDGIEDELSEKLASIEEEQRLLELIAIAESSNNPGILGGLIAVLSRCGDFNLCDSKNKALRHLEKSGTSGIESALSGAMENCSDPDAMQWLLQLAVKNQSPKLNPAILHALCRFYREFKDRKPYSDFSMETSDNIASRLAHRNCAGIVEELPGLIGNSCVTLARYLIRVSEGCDNQCVSKAWLNRMCMEDTPYDFTCRIEGYLAERKAKGVETEAIVALLNTKTDSKKIPLVWLVGSISGPDATKALFEIAFERGESAQVVDAAVNLLKPEWFSTTRDLAPIFKGLVREWEKDNRKKDIQQILFSRDIPGYDRLLMDALENCSSTGLREMLVITMMKRFEEMLLKDDALRAALKEYVENKILPDAGKYPACVFGLWYLGVHGPKYSEIRSDFHYVFRLDNAAGDVKSDFHYDAQLDNTAAVVKKQVLTVLSKGWCESLGLIDISENRFLDVVSQREDLYEFLKRESGSQDAEIAKLAAAAMKTCFPDGFKEPQLSNKNLNSDSCVDAYGIGGGAQSAIGARWGRGRFITPKWREPHFSLYTKFNRK